MAAVLPLLPERDRAAPKPALLWALGVAAVASCAATIALGSLNEELYQPALRVLLVSWVTLPYIFAGIVAWRMRPDSAFGPLMILAGFVTQLSILQWASQPFLNTVGQLSDLLVAAVWLHLFLAYPSGRLAGRAERVVVVIGYVAAVGLQVVILMLGGFNDLHLLTVVERQATAEAVQNVQLLTLSALALIGVGLLWRRWRSLPRWQRRLPTQIVINCFSLTLIMLAALLVAARSSFQASRTSGWQPSQSLGWRHSPSWRGFSMRASPRLASANFWSSCKPTRHQISENSWRER